MNACLPAVVLGLVLITGCMTTRPPEAPQPERLSQQVVRTTLERAQQAYDEGDYAKAIATLKSNGVSVFEAAEPGTRLEAMKLEAFSYCLANQVAECRAQFLKILELFPTFDLSVAERRHPAWGPAFQAAKRQKR